MFKLIRAFAATVLATAAVVAAFAVPAMAGTRVPVVTLVNEGGKITSGSFLQVGEVLHGYGPAAGLTLTVTSLTQLKGGMELVGVNGTPPAGISDYKV